MLNPDRRVDCFDLVVSGLSSDQEADKLLDKLLALIMAHSRNTEVQGCFYHWNVRRLIIDKLFVWLFRQRHRVLGSMGMIRRLPGGPSLNVTQVIGLIFIAVLFLMMGAFLTEALGLGESPFLRVFFGILKLLGL